MSSRRKSIIGYSVGMAFYVLVVVALYPSFKDSTELDQFTEQSEGLAALSSGLRAQEPVVRRRTRVNFSSPLPSLFVVD